MTTKEQIEKNRKKIRDKLKADRERKEAEVKGRLEAKLEAERLEAGKKERAKELEDLASLIAKKTKPARTQKIEFPEIETIKGKNGKDGNNGERGDNGTNGDKGEVGDKGNTGNTGEKGKNGIDGKDGLDGVDGKDANEEKIVEAVLRKIPVQESHYEEIEGLQKKIDELKKDIEDTPKRGKYGLRGIVSLRAGSGITIDESKIGKPIISSSASAGTVENLSGQCNGSDTVLTTTSNNGIIWLSLNGTMLIEGKEFARDSATQITLTFAPETGEELYLKYI
ncbi:hypothetical protein GQ568_02645 [Patescibacteria group bacterium]|nr:hypothetical protein [Patescibacteria group bacterium]